TDDESFPRGIMSTDETGIAEFLAIFPGYYITRITQRCIPSTRRTALLQRDVNQ
ncbi:hypothetical protein BJ875DRAFT_390019, partial [Amylocarpus encephaloides]